MKIKSRNNNDNNKCNTETGKSIYFEIFSLHRELSPASKFRWSGRSRVKITCYTSCAYHEQHVRQVVRRDGSVIKFDRVEIACPLALFYNLKH